MKANSLFCVAVGFLAMAPILNAGVLYDFDDSSQLGDFTLNGGTAAWTYSANGGVDASGGLLASNQTNTSVYTLNQGFAGNLSNFTLSMSFQWKTPTLGVGHGFFIGVGPSDTYVPATSTGTVTAANNQFYFGIGRIAAGSDVARIIGFSSNGSSGSNYQAGTAQNATLTDGAWYSLSGDVAFSDITNQYTVSVTLSSIGAGGALTTLSSYSFTTLATPDLASDASVNAFFGSAGNAPGRGVSAVDNFYTSTAIPEPSTYGLFGMAGLLLFSIRNLNARRALTK